MSRILLSPPHMSDIARELLLDAFDSNWVAPLGPHVDGLEEEFAPLVGREHAVALSSGTAALHLALVMLGVEAGDEVYTSTLTFAATANAVRYTGATPVFIDSDPDSWNMDPDLLAEELATAFRENRLPKAVLVVDLYGQCADYDRILPICARYDVPVVEDAAESLGATYNGHPAGAFGDLAAFSFNGNKIITAGGGGMLVASRRDYAERARFLATQARDPAPHYEHSTVGFNYRMSNLLAATGRGQMQVLRERVAARRANNAFYRGALADVPGIHFMPEIEGGESTFWLTVITVDPEAFGAPREKIYQHLGEHDIESRPAWKPMHLQPAYAGCRYIGHDVADDIFRRGLCLPSGSNLTSRDLEAVVDLVLRTPRAIRGAA